MWLRRYKNNQGSQKTTGLLLASQFWLRFPPQWSQDYVNPFQVSSHQFPPPGVESCLGGPKLCHLTIICFIFKSPIFRLSGSLEIKSIQTLTLRKE